MRDLVLALGIALAATSPVAPPSPRASPDNPCVREIGGRHVPALIGLGPGELEIQTRCLVWEYSAAPKAEFIPSPEPPTPTRAVEMTPIPRSSSGPAALADVLSRRLNLKPAGSPQGGLGPAPGAPSVRAPAVR